MRTPFQGGTYYAMVIGNSRYKDRQKTWSQLNNPVSDAVALENILKERYAFSELNIQLITDATHGDRLRTLNNITK